MKKFIINIISLVVWWAISSTIIIFVFHHPELIFEPLFLMANLLTSDFVFPTVQKTWRQINE